MNSKQVSVISICVWLTYCVTITALKIMEIVSLDWTPLIFTSWLIPVVLIFIGIAISMTIVPIATMSVMTIYYGTKIIFEFLLLEK